MQAKITNNLEALMDVFPKYIKDALIKQDVDTNNLIEVVMDLGRRPKAYFTDNTLLLSDYEVTQSDIDAVVEQIGEFMGDNRAGIERTLHRISAIRNRQDKIIGLTCRVGRAVYGTIDIIQNLLETGQSILLLGRPGVGKTTLLREAARILAESKRVIVVDTSNEIAGDGDIPHPAIGQARRMQVHSPALQHHVMIEAVENHTPQVIIIDEIGRLEEAEAARTIAERGVQLIGTAHGNTLENLLVNPTLSDLIGGIDSVTLSDDEARRRNTQKTVLERRSPPTFDILVEIQTRNRLAVHHSVARAVDALLRNRPIQAEIRYRDESGEIRTETPKPPKQHSFEKTSNRGKNNNSRNTEPNKIKRLDQHKTQTLEDLEEDLEFLEEYRLTPIKIYAYGANMGRLRQAAKELQVPAVIVDSLDESDVLVTVKSHYRKHSQPVQKAQDKNIPFYVLRSNTLPQMERCLADIFALSPKDTDPASIAMRETQIAIRKIIMGTKSVGLSPQNSAIRRMQHEMARQSNVVSQSYGREPQRRVKLFRN